MEWRVVWWIFATGSRTLAAKKISIAIATKQKKKKNDAEKGTTCVTHTCFHRNGLPTIARKCICIPANNRFPSIPIYPVFFFFFKIKLALFFFSPTKTPSITEIILFFERRIYLCANENNRDLISHLSIIIIDSGQINQRLFSRIFTKVCLFFYIHN